MSPEELNRMYREPEDKWISVDDQLPEIGEIVQVWRDEWAIAKRVEVGDTILWHFDGESRYTYHEPTHWMPIPPPPKKKIAQHC